MYMCIYFNKSLQVFHIFLTKYKEMWSDSEWTHVTAGWVLNLCTLECLEVKIVKTK